MSGTVYGSSDELVRRMRRDETIRQRLIARSPHVFAMDAEKVAEMSSSELATRELKELGIEPKANDPVALLDAHHAGREFERGIRNGAKLLGQTSANDSASGSFVDRYLKS